MNSLSGTICYKILLTYPWPETNEVVDVVIDF